ncbi:MAG: class I SAM-dependent methyltransferase [Chloroflexi bacterium]|nr:class I SAM-dependent methyltransferase [Chloroflexota bacterium]
MPRPILDIGCAFGEFGRLFFEGGAAPDVGLDIDRSELLRERSAPGYGSVAQCDARSLPFKDGAFGTVMSVSTLEHVPDVAPAFPEIARVVRPGGVLAMSVPIEGLNENLMGYGLLRAANLGLAKRYADVVHRSLTHVNIWKAERWASLVREAGFDIQRMEPILSPAATRAFEALLPAAYANRFFRQLTGRRPPHPRPFVLAMERALRSLVLNDSPRGSNLFLVARRPER